MKKLIVDKKKPLEALGLKIIVALIVLYTLILPDFASAALITEYKATTTDYTAIRGGVWRGQTFNITSTTLLEAIELNISKIGTPPAVFQINIFATNSSGGITGAPLSTNTFASSLVTNIGIDNATLKNFTISSIILTAGKYAWATNATAGDASNQYIMRGVTTGTYANGSQFNSATGTTGSWTEAASDLQFAAYGEDLSISNPSINILSPTSISYGEIGKVVSLNFSAKNSTSCYYNYDYGRWSFESNKSEGWNLDKGTVCNRSATCNPTLGSFGIYATTGGTVMNKTFYNLRNISFTINESTSVISGRLYLDINGVNVNSTASDGTLSYTNPSNGSALVTIRTPALTTGIQPAFDGTIDNILINGKDGDSLSCSTNSSLSISPTNQLTFYVQDAFGKVESNTSSWEYDLFLNSKTYSASSTSGSTESYTANITYNTNYPIITPKLNYNQTNYTATTSDTGANRLYSVDVVTPSVFTQTNKSIYWIFDLVGFSESLSLQSNSFNQSINSFAIDNCSSLTNHLLNFTMFDQESRLPINGTIEFTAEIYSVGTDTLINSYNSTFNYRVGTQSAVCISNISSSYKLAYIIKFYGNSTYFQQYKTIQNLVVSNATLPQQIRLYNLLAASGYPFTVSVRGSDRINNQDILVDAQRQYVGLDSFESVESSVTDSSGNTVIHLVQGSVVYNFIISYNGEVLGSFNNNQVLCTNQLTGDCDVILNLATSNAGILDLENYGNLSISLALNNNRTLFTTFSSIDGLSRTVRQDVIKNDGYGNSTICSSSITSTSGTFVCAIPTLYGNTTFIAQTFSDGKYLGATIFSLGASGTTIFYGVRTFLMMLLYSTLVLMMLSNPVLIVIGAILGIMIGGSFLLIEGGSSLSVISSIIYFIAAGGIIIWQITKRI